MWRLTVASTGATATAAGMQASSAKKPAQVLRTSVTDRTFIRKQRDLMHDVDEVLMNIRQWPSSHPQNRGWKEPWPDAKDYPL